MSMTLEVTLVEEWLAAKGITLWANWDISDAKGRRIAAEWYLKQNQSLREFRQDNYNRRYGGGITDFPRNKAGWDVVSGGESHLQVKSIFGWVDGDGSPEHPLVTDEDHLVRGSE